MEVPPTMSSFTQKLAKASVSLANCVKGDLSSTR